MSDLQQRVARLSPEKRAVLEQQLLKRQQGTTNPPVGIPRRNSQAEGSLPPLSFAQQRLWFLDQLEPGSATFNICRAIRLLGALDVPALQQALAAIIDRHEAMRTTFTVIDGEPAQVIAGSWTFELPVVDLASQQPGASPDGLTAEITGWLRREAQRPFDLSRDLMMRATLLRLAEGEHILLFVKHHIASDAWSAGIFVQELVSLYESFATGRPACLPDLPIQYADYALWQRNWLQGEVLQRQLAYWTEKLACLSPSLELPADRSRPPSQTFHGAEETVTLPAALAEALRRLSHSANATLFMTLLAAFKVLLYRYSGQTDIAVGSPIAGRKWVEVERLIGFFLNNLVLRTDLSGVLTFRQLLQRVRITSLEALAHQDLPFERLVEALNVARNLSHSPLF